MDFADGIKVRNLKIGRLRYLGGRNAITWALKLKQRTSSEWRQKKWGKRKSQRKLKNERIWNTISGLKIEGTRWQRIEAALRSCKRLLAAIQKGNEDFILKVSRNWMLPITWMESGSGFSPRASSKSAAWLTPWFWPRETQSRGTRKPTWTFNLQSCEIINLCCFKSLNLW